MDFSKLKLAPGQRYLYVSYDEPRFIAEVQETYGTDDKASTSSLDDLIREKLGYKD